MSLGKSKSRSSQQSTSSTFTDPVIVGAQFGNIANAQRAAGSIQPFTGQRVAGFNDTQRQAQEGLLSAARSGLGAGLLGQATQAAQAGSTYRPMQIAAPTAQGGQAVAASTATARPDVTTSAITGDQIAGYLNPYTDEVVNTSLADLERQRQIEQTYNAARATKAGAFGGTGAAVLSSLTNDNFARTGASTAANLRQQGFTTALQAAQQDAARRLQADQGNQAAGNDMSRFNAGQTQATDIFNSGQGQALNIFNAQQQLEAERANQSAGIAGAGLNLQGGGLLSSLADQERDFALSDLDIVSQVGNARQAQEQRELTAALEAWQQGAELTLRQQELVNQAFAILGNPVLSRSQSTGTSTSKGFNIGIPLPGSGG